MSASQILLDPTSERAPVARALTARRDRRQIDRRDEYAGHLEWDLGNLTAYDPAPLDASQFAADGEAQCLEFARAITQSLTARLFDLPSEPVPGGRIALLPPPSTSFGLRPSSGWSSTRRTSASLRIRTRVCASADRPKLLNSRSLQPRSMVSADNCDGRGVDMG